MVKANPFLSVLEDSTPRIYRGKHSTVFPIQSISELERLEQRLIEMGLKWKNYGIDPDDGFVINFRSASDAVAAKLLHE